MFCYSTVIITDILTPFWFFGRQYTKIKSMNTTLIIIRGVPGGGKSYLAEALQASIGQDNVVILDPDRIDKSGAAFVELSARLAAEGVDEKFHPYRFLRQTGYDALTAGKSVIWTQAFNDFNGFEITIKRMQEFADEHQIPLRVLVVEVEIDGTVARDRIKQRVAGGGHDVPDENLSQFMNSYESFVGRGYETVIVNGADNIDESVTTIKSTLGV